MAKQTVVEESLKEDKPTNAQVNASIEQLYNLQENYNIVKGAYEAQVSLVKRLLELISPQVSSDLDQGTVSLKTRSGYRLQVRSRRSVSYDVNMLMESYEPDICNGFITKTYNVISADKLKQELKAHGLVLKDLKGALSITKSVDKAKLEEALDMGLVELPIVSKCAIVKISEPKLTVIKE